MNDYTVGNIFELTSGNETLSAEQQAKLDRIDAFVEAKQFKQLEHYLQQTRGIEQLLIDRVMIDPTDNSRWDWLIGYELIATIEDFARVNSFGLTAYTYHPDDPFYFALALYWTGWNDFVITDEHVALAESLIEQGPEDVSGLLCIALAKEFSHLKQHYYQLAIERCPWAPEPYLWLGQRRLYSNPAEGKMLIQKGLDRVLYKWEFDQKGCLINAGPDYYFNPTTWRRYTISELFGLSMNQDEYKKYERMINPK